MAATKADVESNVAMLEVRRATQSGNSRNGLLGASSHRTIADDAHLAVSFAVRPHFSWLWRQLKLDGRVVRIWTSEAANDVNNGGMSLGDCFIPGLRDTHRKANSHRYVVDLILAVT